MDMADVEASRDMPDEPVDARDDLEPIASEFSSPIMSMVKGHSRSEDRMQWRTPQSVASADGATAQSDTWPMSPVGEL